MVSPASNRDRTLLEQPVEPFAKIDFKSTSRNWEIYDSRFPLVRELEFSTQVKGSFFTNIKILGYRNGEVLISLSFDENNREFFEKYFAEYEIECSFENFQSGYLQSRDKAETEKFFNMFIQHNSFPAEQLELVTALVEKGNWYEVTPLKEGESLPQERVRADDYLIQPYR